MTQGEMFQRLRAALRPKAASLDLGSWDDGDAPVAAVCHPDWRGVWAAAHGHGVPVIETSDAETHSGDIISHLLDRSVRVLVVQGFPPGSGRLITDATEAGIATRCVLHSSMAQHGAEIGETEVIDELVALLGRGSLGRLGFVKEGQAEAFTALGHQASYVPNRVPVLAPFEPLQLGPGFHVGVFAEPFWRKSVNTQLGAVALLDGATAHVLQRPAAGYLGNLDIVEHGVLPRDEYLRLQGSMDLNLYVTLSECFPLSPLESYAAGIPCLTSRTSVIFRSDPELWDLTTVDELDNPRAIAVAAQRLLSASSLAVGHASAWMETWDEEAATRWEQFVAP